jgi:hypothetical protein
MKQQEATRMPRKYLGEFDRELEFWEGYEFWSAQLEAKMEEWGDSGAESLKMVDLTRSEGCDVLPF